MRLLNDQWEPVVLSRCGVSTSGRRDLTKGLCHNSDRQKPRLKALRAMLYRKELDLPKCTYAVFRPTAKTEKRTPMHNHKDDKSGRAGVIGDFKYGVRFWTRIYFVPESALRSIYPATARTESASVRITQLTKNDFSLHTSHQHIYLTRNSRTGAPRPN